MKTPSWRKILRGTSLQRDVEKIRDILIRYVKEETIQPVKDVGRFAAFGALGSVFVGFGTLLLLVGALRFLQEQFTVFHGNLSWLPYVIVAALATLVLVLTGWRILSSSTLNKHLKGK